MIVPSKPYYQYTGPYVERFATLTDYWVVTWSEAGRVGTVAVRGFLNLVDVRDFVRRRKSVGAEVSLLAELASPNCVRRIRRGEIPVLRRRRNQT